jgi:hypothetical protein
VHKLKGRESDFPHLAGGDSMRILKPLLLTLAMMLPVSPAHAQTPAPSRMPQDSMSLASAVRRMHRGNHEFRGFALEALNAPFSALRRADRLPDLRRG